MWSTDIMYRQIKSFDFNRYAQVFYSRTNFTKIYPMAKKSYTQQALKKFTMELGVPDEMMFYRLKE